MTSDLRDLLDRPLPGEPAPRPPADVVATARRGLGRRRLAATGLVAAAAVTVGGVAVAVTEPGATVADPVPAAGQPAQAPPNSWLRERYPASAALADCLVERGYPVRVGLRGGIGFEGSAAAADAFTIDLTGCQRELKASRAETAPGSGG